MGSPELVYEEPAGDKSLTIDKYVPTRISIMTFFDFAEEDYCEWVYSSDRHGTYSPGGDWSAISGKNTFVLTFVHPMLPQE